MRKIITFNDLIAGLMGAIGYGLGYVIPEMMGLPALVSFVICLVVGDWIDGATRNLLMREEVRNNPSMRKKVVLGLLLLFLLFSVLSDVLFAHSLAEDVQSQVFWVILLPIASVALSTLRQKIRIWQLRKHFGDDSQTFHADAKARNFMDALNKSNRKLEPAQAAHKLAAKTKTGIYVGESADGVIAYKGIPYAKAPMGELRWKAPQPLDSSEEVWEAKYFGASCFQEEAASFALRDHRQSEDCLTLNIWRGKTLGQKCPVIVYIHGGDFSYGGTANPFYYGNHFVAANPGAVFVSVNYRLGLLGFVDFSKVPGGESYPDAANLGLLDQLEALRWIHENIAAFGGDPDNVTLMGDSAGAQSIALLMASGKAEGLFHKSFLISLPTFFAHSDAEGAQQIGQLMMELSGSQNMDDLMKLNGEQLKAIQVLMEYRNLFALPTLDGSFLPKNIMEALQNGAAQGKPTVIGLSSEESSIWFMDDAAQGAADRISWILNTIAQRLPEAQGAALKKRLEQKTCDERRIFEDVLYRTPTQQFCDAMGEANPVYGFYWDIHSPVKQFRANGTACLVSILGNKKVAEQVGYVIDANVQEIMQAMIMKFITGKPMETFDEELHGLKAIEWKPYGEQHQTLYVSTKKIACEENLFRADDSNAK